MRVAFASIALLSSMALVGCSSSSGGGSSGDGGTSGASIDCAWLNDANNCFAKFVDDVTSCIGGSAGPGLLDVDGRTCTYPGGDPLVTFNTPLGSTIAGGSNGTKDMHFTMTSGGVTCLEHTEHMGDFGFTSKGPNGTFQISYASNAVTVSCPDGSTLHGDVGALTAQCKSDFDAKMPGTHWSETNPTFTFKPGTSLIWHCARTH
jgi:hypothetical protein